MSEPDENGFLFTRDYDDGKGQISYTIDVDYKARVVMKGDGSMSGTNAFVTMLDQALDELGRDKHVFAKVDLRGLSNSPLRAQFVLGKWLFRNKKVIKNLAIFGGKAWEMKLARVIMKIAKMPRVGFFDTEPQAVQFLGWDGP